MALHLVDHGVIPSCQSITQHNNRDWQASTSWRSHCTLSQIERTPMWLLHTRDCAPNGAFYSSGSEDFNYRLTFTCWTPWYLWAKNFASKLLLVLQTWAMLYAKFAVNYHLHIWLRKTKYVKTLSISFIAFPSPRCNIKTKQQTCWMKT